MNSRFEIVGLTRQHVARALPVVQATWPDVDLASWESFVQPFAAPAAPSQSGVLALSDASGTLCGLLAYRRDQDLRQPVLAVQLFTVVDLANSPLTARALLDAAEIRARELGCPRVEIRLYQEQGELMSRLHALGLASEACLLQLKVAPARALS
jgi:hypothetical protein